MDVVGIGDVGDYCKQRGWNVLEEWDGEPLEYPGPEKMIVWGGYHKMFEFYYIKYRLLRRGIGLRGTQEYGDMGYVLDQFVEYLARREREEHKGGRTAFGWRTINGRLEPVPEELAIADRVLLLREGGCGYREIERRLKEEGRLNRLGRPIGVSTIMRICEREEFYRGQ